MILVAYCLLVWVLAEFCSPFLTLALICYCPTYDQDIAPKKNQQNIYLVSMSNVLLVQSQEISNSIQVIQLIWRMSPNIVNIVVKTITTKKQLTHQSVECGRCINQSKRHYFELIQTSMGDSCALRYLPISSSDIERGKEPITFKLSKDLLWLSPLCWHHDTTGAINTSGYPWRPHLSILEGD